MCCPAGCSCLFGIHRTLLKGMLRVLECNCVAMLHRAGMPADFTIGWCDVEV